MLTDDDPKAVASMIKYFYSFDYEIIDSSNHAEAYDHLEVYCLADKYDVLDLRNISLKKFRQSMGEYERDTCAFLPLIKAVYADTTSANDDIRCATVNTWLCGERTPENSVEIEELRSKMGEMPEFVTDLALRYAQVFDGSRPTIWCKKCGHYYSAYSVEEVTKKSCTFCGNKNTNEDGGSVHIEGTLHVTPCWEGA